jgi:CHC2 zinc finger
MILEHKDHTMHDASTKKDHAMTDSTTNRQTEPAQIPDVHAIQRFFEVLYPDVGDGYLVLSWPSPTRRHKDGRQALESSWHNLATTGLDRIAARAMTLARTHSVYFGVALQHPSRQPNPFQRSQNASAYVLPGFYFDLDLASGAHAASALPTKAAQAMGFLHALPAPPSLVLHTGGGLHAYWLFETPLSLTTDAERTAVSQVLRQFAYTVCKAGTAHGWTLDALRDLARVLRPPGTINHKYGRRVQVLTETDERYTLADFDWLTPLPALSVQPGSGESMQDQPDLLTIIEAYGGSLTEKSAQEWHGAHPVHGSSTGVNFDVNRSKGLWHCWRHGTGGDALALIAVCAGLVACEDLQPGCLAGARFSAVLTIAQAQFGWHPAPPSRPSFPTFASCFSPGLASTLRSTL